MARPEMQLEQRSRELASLIWESGCLKFGNFTLTSGKKSPYYLDLRVLPSHPKLFDRAASKASELIREKLGSIDCLCAVATGGLPVGTLLANKLEVPMIYVRQEKKSHGEGQKIEGLLRDGADVLVVDDISTTGGSVLGAVEIIRKQGGRVKNAFVLLDRCQGASENLAAQHVDLICLAAIELLVEQLGERGNIAQSVVNEVKSYLVRE